MLGPEDELLGPSDIIVNDLVIGRNGVNIGVEFERRQIQPAYLSACFTGAFPVGARQCPA